MTAEATPKITVDDDSDADAQKLSPTAKKMLELREQVLTEWERRLRSTVKEARSLSHPIIINTFPAMYENLAQIISPNYPRTNIPVTNTVASEHGGERARLTNYNPPAVITEYQLLRWTILDVLRQNDAEFTHDEFTKFNDAIDGAIRDSVDAFALAQSALREQFVLALTHDLRNPLGAASIAAHLIRHSTDLTKIHGFAEKIADNLGRMDHMITDLLDTVVFQSGDRMRLHLSEFDILDAIKEVVDEFETTSNRRLEIVGESCAGWWDREAIKRALENLVNNAVKYGQPETPIRIKVEHGHGRLALAVHNEGNPIAAEEIESVFQVFRRAEAARRGDTRGWGIGLPFVRAVAESHGGSVGVDSADDRGTTFTIDIPQDARPFLDAPTLASPGASLSGAVVDVGRPEG